MNDKQNVVLEPDENGPLFSLLNDNYSESEAEKIFSEEILSLSGTDAAIASMYWYMEMNTSEVAKALRIPRLIVQIKINQIKRKIFRFTDDALPLEEQRKLVQNAMVSAYSHLQINPWLVTRVINCSQQKKEKPSFLVGIEVYIMLGLLFLSAGCAVFFITLFHDIH